MITRSRKMSSAMMTRSSKKKKQNKSSENNFVTTTRSNKRGRSATRSKDAPTTRPHRQVKSSAPKSKSIRSKPALKLKVHKSPAKVTITNKANRSPSSKRRLTVDNSPTIPKNATTDCMNERNEHSQLPAKDDDTQNYNPKSILPASSSSSFKTKTAKKKKNKTKSPIIHQTTSPPRRSKRDTNSIKLRGTMHTFYRRLQILFFEESTTEEEYEDIFLGGRRRSSKRKRIKEEEENENEEVDNDTDMLKTNDDNKQQDTTDTIQDTAMITEKQNVVSPETVCGSPVVSHAMTSSALSAIDHHVECLLEHCSSEFDNLQQQQQQRSGLDLPIEPTRQQLDVWLDHRKIEWQRVRNLKHSNGSSITAPSSHNPTTPGLPIEPTKQQLDVWLDHRKSEWQKLRNLKHSSGSSITPLSHNPTTEELTQWMTQRKQEWRLSRSKLSLSSSSSSLLIPTSEPSSTLTNDIQHDSNHPDNTTTNNDYHNEMTVERVTKPDEAAIYVVDNFLTENELQYFDEKIRSKSLRFEKSFVDNMAVVDRVHHHKEEECNDKNNDDVGDGVEEEEEGTDGGPDDNTDEMKGGDEGNETEGAEKDDDDDDNQDDNEDDDDEEEMTIKGSNASTNNRTGRVVVDTTHRTSTFVSFRKLQDSKIAGIEQRIADMFGCFVPQIEALQMVRYTPGQFFGIHHDMGEIDENDIAITPPKNIFIKRRLVTIFIYLNTLDVDQGGSTYFPKCNNLRVRPIRGRAVIWSNVTSDGQADSRTIHAGEPVVKTAVRRRLHASKHGCGGGGSLSSKVSLGNFDTHKYGINVWICEE